MPVVGERVGEQGAALIDVHVETLPLVLYRVGQIVDPFRFIVVSGNQFPGDLKYVINVTLYAL